MARTRRSELAAGLFVIVCGVLLVGVVVWLAGVRLGGQDIYLSVPLSAGNVNVMEGSEVLVGTARVGKVTSVRPSGDWQRFEITARLDRPVRIGRDAVVETATPPLGGNASLVFVDLGKGEASSWENPIELRVGPSPLVRDLQRELGYGEQERTAFQKSLANVSATVENLALISSALKVQLTENESPNMLSNAAETLATLRESADELRQQMGVLRLQLDGDNAAGMLAKMHVSLDDINKTTGEVSEMTAALRPEVEKTVANVSEAAGLIGEYTRSDLAEMLAALRESSSQLLVIMRDFQEISSSTREVVVMNQENIDSMLSNLTQVSVTLKAAAREIRLQPWRLLGKPTVEDVRSQNILEAARSFAEGAAVLDDAINRLNKLTEMSRESITADDPQLIQVRQRIRDAFGQFIQAEQALWQEMKQ